MKLLSPDHLIKLLKISPANGKKCPFLPITEPNPLDPFQGRETFELKGSYVTRDDRETEVIIELKDITEEQGVVLGNAFTLYGEYIELTPEEEARIEKQIWDSLPQ